jgi:small subunit ribosomal protein S5
MAEEKKEKVNKKVPTKKKFVSKEFEKNKKGPRRRRAKRPMKARSEYDQKIVSIRRVTRVVAGGRRFSFSVSMVIGNRKGSVGVGVGKASDTALAIEKAIRDAKNHLIIPNLTKNNSIPFEVSAKYCASKVLIMPTPGRGLKAGGAVRTVLDLLGADDISAKILSRSKNHLNNARAAIKALSQVGIKSPVKIEKKLAK